jgi:hypothetical protein
MTTDKKINAILCACLVMGIFLVANTANAQSANDTVRVNYQVSTDGNLSFGNVQRIVSTNRLDLTVRNSNFVLKENFSFIYGEAFKTVTERDYINRLQLDMFTRHTFFPMIYNRMETNLRRQIDFRFQTGAGIGVHAFNKPNNLLTLYLVGAFDNTQFVASDVSYQIARVGMSVDARQTLPRTKIIITEVVYLMQGLNSGPSNYLAIGIARLAMRIHKHFSFTVNANYSYESIVTPTRENQNFALTYGILYSHF